MEWGMELTLEVKEIEYILNVIAQRPYIESAELIQKIQQQAQPKNTDINQEN